VLTTDKSIEETNKRNKEISLEDKENSSTQPVQAKSGLANRMQMFEKKGKTIEEKELKPMNSLSDKKKLFETPQKEDNTRNTYSAKPTVSINESETKISRSQTNEITTNSGSSLKDRIKMMEAQKDKIEVKKEEPVYKPFKLVDDKVSDREREMFERAKKNLNKKKNTNTNKEAETEGTEGTESSELKTRPARVKSIRITNIAKELEKHLLNGNGKANPEIDNIIQNDEYESIISNKSVYKNSMIRKKTLVSNFL